MQQQRPASPPQGWGKKTVNLKVDWVTDSIKTKAGKMARLGNVLVTQTSQPELDLQSVEEENKLLKAALPLPHACFAMSATSHTCTITVEKKRKPPNSVA